MFLTIFWNVYLKLIFFFLFLFLLDWCRLWSISVLDRAGLGHIQLCLLLACLWQSITVPILFIHTLIFLTHQQYCHLSKVWHKDKKVQLPHTFTDCHFSNSLLSLNLLSLPTVSHVLQLLYTMDQYHTIKQLGDGTYGSVILARKQDTSQLVAIKR